jgi:hypothetical protein
MALTAPQRLLAQGLKALYEYVPVLLGGTANAYNVPALNASGQLDITMMPTGVGADTQIITASEAITAGALVNIYSNAGSPAVRNADGSTTGKQAHGFTLSAIASGSAGTIYLSGLDTAVTGLTPGDAYLSDTTPGAVATAGATIAGHTYQQVGVVTSAGVLQYDYNPPVTRA